MQPTDDTAGADRLETLDAAELWTRDSFAAAATPDFFMFDQVDMSRAKALRSQLNRERSNGQASVSYAHMYLRAVALALRGNPDLHVLYSGRQRLYPANIDVALSVAGSTVSAPLLIVRNAADKSLREIANEVTAGTPAVLAAQQEEFEQLRRWGRLVPFAWLRRAIIRALMRRLHLLRRNAGTFHVTCLNSVEFGVPLLLAHSGLLTAGRVLERPVAIGGDVEVRPTVTVGCCASHAAWQGRDMARFMKHVRRVLESGEFE